MTHTAGPCQRDDGERSAYQQTEPCPAAPRLKLGASDEVAV